MSVIFSVTMWHYLRVKRAMRRETVHLIFSLVSKSEEDGRKTPFIVLSFLDGLRVSDPSNSVLTEQW